MLRLNQGRDVTDKLELVFVGRLRGNIDASSNSFQALTDLNQHSKTSIGAMLARTLRKRRFVPWSSLFWLRQWFVQRRFSALFNGEPIDANGTSLPQLTREQREAATSLEHATIVVASAGSGKTGTIVARVAYLVKSRRAKAKDILLLAFNRSAARQLQDRCSAIVGETVEAKTFNALGLAILKSSGTKRVRLSRLAEDGRYFATFLSETIGALYADPSFARDTIRLIRIDQSPLLKAQRPSTLAEYNAQTRSEELRALNGQLVKSRGELDIANYLYVRGVNFHYEPYFSDIVAGGPADYRPDFFLPESNVFIEFFGIDRAGDTAPQIDKANYERQMRWKSEVHRKHGTNYVALYGWQKTEGNLIKELTKFLRNFGVKEKKLSPDKFLKEINALEWETEFSNLITTFLAHFKSNGLSIAGIYDKAEALEGVARARALAFLRVFDAIYSEYENHLAARHEIDFSDMIVLATRACQSPDRRFPWTHVIVDEFQDISAGRHAMLNTLIHSSPARLFVVGDDWQSINRFAGSDTGIMTHADRYMKKPALLFLSKTFRFGQNLADISSRFVMQNPAQIPKKVIGQSQGPTSPVTLWWTDQDLSKALEELVCRLTEAIDIDEPTLMILGRYRASLPKPQDIAALRQIWPGDIQVHTVHGSKGLEADHVIVVDVRDNSGPRSSFPSEITDDPLLELVMPLKETFPHAEERRLFYVALTRSRSSVDVICSAESPSAFALELCSEDGVTVKGAPLLNGECRACPPADLEGGARCGTIRWNRKNRWTSPTPSQCDNPSCQAKLSRCPACGSGFTIPTSAHSSICNDGLCCQEFVNGDEVWPRESHDVINS